MSWARVSRQHPCGICQKPDWCTVGEKGWCCMRVESPHTLKNGGWFHPFEGGQVPVPEPRKKNLPPVPQSINPAKLLREWWTAGNTIQLSPVALAQSLGVRSEALASLGCVWAPPHRAWAFPMRDGYGEIVGIRLRSDDGRKWAVRGSKQGIFIPDTPPQSVVYLPEGPTSTAAALTLGLYAIGRPSCSTGGSELKVALKRLGVRQAVIVADNDDRWNEDLKRFLKPGLDGAEKLATELGIKSIVWTPPTKDIREFLQQGGTAELVRSQIKNFVWKIPK